MPDSKSPPAASSAHSIDAFRGSINEMGVSINEIGGSQNHERLFFVISIKQSAHGGY
jgi:hypothetical protein